MNYFRASRFICLTLFGMVGLVYAVSPSNQTTIHGRRKSGLPPAGYSHTQLIPGQSRWRVHDIERPEPAIIDLGSTVQAPSDAIVLFDGNDLNQWTSQDGSPAAWKVEDGYFEVNGRGNIVSRPKFGSCQLHLEWATPMEVVGKGQGRGNSGVMLMTFYEIQILDSFENRTYSDGQAAAIYGQHPPLVNASRCPGEWQTFDIVFEAPEFAEDKLLRPAYVTVLHNGIIVHHRTEIVGRVAHEDPAQYAPHATEMPILLQDHGNPIRFRNIWVRPLTGYDEG